MATPNLHTNSITLLDPSSDPITGATFTVTLFDGPSGALSTSLVAVTELGSGVYEVTSGPLTETGFYTLTVQANDTWSQVYTDTWDVSPVYEISALTPVTQTTTLLAIRRRVARKIGDFRLFTATAGGSTTTFIDVDHIVLEPGAYAQRQAYVTSGTTANIGQYRVIASSNRSTATLVFNRALPSATAIGDEIEVYFSYGIGLEFEGITAAIQEALDIAAHDSQIPASATIPDVYDGRDEFSITIPDEFVAVHKLQYETSHGRWKDVSVATTLGANGWYVDTTTRTILLQGVEGCEIAGSTVRLFGFIPPPPVNVDTDLIYADAEWVVNYACYQALMNVVSSRQQPGDWTSKALLYKQEADKNKFRLTPNLPPNYRRLA